MTTDKIDLVYLWCDANDDDFYIKKNSYISLENNLDTQSSTDARWFDNDELKYSLRSVEKFIPWINHIYIITDNQIPKWLNTNNPKITIIDHKDIIPQKYLPTFNSNVIEGFIPYIKGLSEYFLYANDDFFVNDYLEPSYFFTDDGKPIVNVKNAKLSNTKSLYVRWLLEQNKRVNKQFGTNNMLDDSHNIIPYRKSFLIDNLNDKFTKQWFEETFTHKFRKEDDLQRFIHVLLDNVKKRNVLRIHHKHKRDVSFVRKVYNYIFNICNYEFMYISAHPELVLKYNPKLFCINDTEELTNEKRKNNKKFLEQYFNIKSSFEK